jgi:hypothetical protein
MTKIKALNETVWERHAAEPAVVEWLENFAASNGLVPIFETNS